MTYICHICLSIFCFVLGGYYNQHCRKKKTENMYRTAGVTIFPVYISGSRGFDYVF